MITRLFSTAIFLSSIAYCPPVGAMTLQECLAQARFGNPNEYRARCDQCRAAYANSPSPSKPSEARPTTSRTQREAKPENTPEKTQEASAAPPSPESDLATCAERSGNKSIAACSRVIVSGRLEENDLATVYVLRAMTNRNSGDYDRAVADFARAIDLLQKFATPNVIATAYVARANAYSLKGDFDNALTDYRSALGLDPYNEQAADGIKQTNVTPSAAIPPALAAPTTEPAKPAKACSEGLVLDNDGDCVRAKVREKAATRPDDKAPLPTPPNTQRNATHESFALSRAGTISTGEAVVLTTPDGRKMKCIGGRVDRLERGESIPRRCAWQ